MVEKKERKGSQHSRGAGADVLAWRGLRLAQFAISTGVPAPDILDHYLIQRVYTPLIMIAHNTGKTKFTFTSIHLSTTFNSLLKEVTIITTINSSQDLSNAKCWYCTSSRYVKD
jgi:hypothetical protein